MEENKNQEGVVSENQSAPLDNNPQPDTASTEEAVVEPKPEEVVMKETVAETQTVPEPAPETAITENNQPTVDVQTDKQQTENDFSSASKEVEPEIKAEPLPAVENTNGKKGGILGKVIFIIIIILVVFLLVKFFSNNETGINVLSTIANVNIRVSNEKEQGTVNIVEEDNRKLNETVSDEAANQPQLVPTPATGAASASTVKIIAYYPNTIKNPGALDCSKVFPLERNAERKYDSNVINTIRGLLAPLTPEEKALGFITTIPAGTMLKTVRISDKGVAEVNFTATLNRMGGSCAVAAARAQIEQTVRQFPQVKSVLICVDGNCQQNEILQP